MHGSKMIQTQALILAVSGLQRDKDLPTFLDTLSFKKRIEELFIAFGKTTPSIPTRR